MIKNQPTKFKPGIYFGLSNKQYHSDGALSASGAKVLYKSVPLDFWYKSAAFNPNHISTQTKAMEESDMFHMLLLEPERFYANYQVNDNSDPYKKLVRESLYEDIKYAVSLVRKLPKTNALLSDGVPEVSIFFPDEETGLMMRCRPDYLKHNACIDYKAHIDVSSEDIRWHIKRYFYDLQAGLYIQGIKTIRRMLKEGTATVYGECDDAWLERFLSTDEMHFVFTFQRKTPPYIIRTVEVGNDVIELGKQKVDAAIQKYIECLEQCGTDVWPAGTDQIELLEACDLPVGIFYN